MLGVCSCLSGSSSSGCGCRSRVLGLGFGIFLGRRASHFSMLEGSREAPELQRGSEGWRVEETLDFSRL